MAYVHNTINANTCKSQMYFVMAMHLGSIAFWVDGVVDSNATNSFSLHAQALEQTHCSSVVQHRLLCIVRTGTNKSVAARRLD